MFVRIISQQQVQMMNRFFLLLSIRIEYSSDGDVDIDIESRNSVFEDVKVTGLATVGNAGWISTRVASTGMEMIRWYSCISYVCS